MAENMLIRDHKQTILNLLQEGEMLLAAIGDGARAQGLSEVRRETEAKTSPVIMFYGLYNAGKSTTINALCQADVAPVGDKPTTTTIQEVPWNGYTFIDTPGIDAHDDHTQTAEGAIQKSDVILFVMDNADTFDNALVYKAILDILDKGKPLAVVINQKNVDEDEDPNTPVPEQKFMQRIVGKVSVNLEIQGEKSGFELVAQRKNFLGIFSMNAFMAYSSKELSSAEDRELMCNVSGITSLKNALDSGIRRSQQLYMLQTPMIQLRDALSQAAAEFQTAPIYGEKQQVAKNRSALLASRQRLRDRLMADGLRKIEAALEQVKSAAASGQPVEDASQRLSKELNELLEGAANEEQEILRTELRLDAMSDYQPVTGSLAIPSEAPAGEDVDLSDLAVFLPVIIEIPGVPIPIPMGLILKIAEMVIGWLTKSDDDQQKQAAESQERLANYYRWLNELRDQEVKIKADYEKAVNDFLAQSYNPRLEKLDRVLAEVDGNCAEHTKNLRKLEQLQLRVGDEMVALTVS